MVIKKSLFSVRVLGALIELTCAYYTVGSYASLSVPHSLDINSYLKKYYSSAFEISPHDVALIGASRINTNYTLKFSYLVNK